MRVGLANGKIQWLMKKIKAVLKAYSLPLFAKVMLGAIAIFGIAVFAPSLLFSGQHAMHSVVEMGLELPVLVLFGLSLLKLLFLEICLETGWTGGDIFPITFASILQGKDNNYDTDAFVPIMDRIQQLACQSDAERQANL